MPTFSAWPVKFAEGEKKNQIKYAVHQNILTYYYSSSKNKLAEELINQH